MDFTLREVIALGGICVGAGGIITWTAINTSNISRLWDKKQDKEVCVLSHNHIAEDIKDIKIDVKELVKAEKRRNGGKE